MGEKLLNFTLFRRKSEKKQKKEAPKQEAAPAQPQELSEKEKAKQRAAGILKMHLDEEKGSPIPQQYPAVRPAKDY